MGKYLRKPNLTTDVVAVMDISSHSTLGVRTRAKTLALQQLQAAGTTATPPPDHHPEISYLQLRSRKLEKPPLQDSRCCKQQNPNPRLVRSSLVIRSGSGGSGSNCVNVRDLEEEVKANCGFGSDQDASFGENNLDFDCRERGTRESTPCSFIRDTNDIITPGSHTRPADRHASSRITQRIMPSAQEIEEFFARHAQEQQRLFSEKYNFDIVNEKPLQGRYEWVRVQP